MHVVVLFTIAYLRHRIAGYQLRRHILSQGNTFINYKGLGLLYSPRHPICVSKWELFVMCLVQACINLQRDVTLYCSVGQSIPKGWLGQCVRKYSSASLMD